MPFPQNQRSMIINPCSAQFSGPGGPATSGVWLGWSHEIMRVTASKSFKTEGIAVVISISQPLGHN